MMKSLNLWIPAAVVAAAVALALYARPRAYQADVPRKAPAESVASTTLTTSTARITGRVIWKGELPRVPRIEGMVGGVGRGPEWEKIANPAEPQINPNDRGIGNAVVFLKHVGTERKPFQYPPFRIEINELGVALKQGDIQAGIGLIRLGDTVEMAPRGASYHMIRARGAEFFTFPIWDPAGLPRLAILGGIAATTLPQAAPDRSVKHTFDHSGHVAFTSGTGNFWCQADAFVCEHPYYTATDAHGRFELTGVPLGEYEIVAWLKNWNIAGKDRDPETGRIMRLHFEPPFTTVGKVDVINGQTTETELQLP